MNGEKKYRASLDVCSQQLVPQFSLPLEAVASPLPCSPAENAVFSELWHGSAPSHQSRNGFRNLLRSWNIVAPSVIIRSLHRRVTKVRQLYWRRKAWIFATIDVHRWNADERLFNLRKIETKDIGWVNRGGGIKHPFVNFDPIVGTWCSRCNGWRSLF